MSDLQNEPVASDPVDAEPQKTEIPNLKEDVLFSGSKIVDTENLYKTQPRQKNQGPFPFSVTLLAMALCIGAGGYLIGKLSGLPGSEKLFPGVIITQSENTNVGLSEQNDTLALVRFAGRAVVYVDENKLGIFNERLRLALPPGKHTIRLEGLDGNSLNETLTFDTKPAENLEFDLRPSGALQK